MGSASATVSRGRSNRTLRLAPVLVLMFLLVGATSAFGITRSAMLARAQVWVDEQVPYSQTHWFGGYRTDCSGYNSMVWQLTSNGHPLSLSTRSLHTVSTTITPDALLPGDAMIKYNYHTRVFYGWADAAHTSYVAYEQTGPTMKSSVKVLAEDLALGYQPYRRRGVTSEPPAWNAVANPTFDVWASGAPVWWQASGGSASTICTRSVDVTKSGNNALGLTNPSSRARDVVGLSQVTTVTVGTPYTLSVWARTSGAPSGLELRLQFLDASGKTLVTTYTTGAAWSIEATRLAKMSVSATAPALATSATVSVRLAGGVDTSGTAGVRAVMDDFRFYDGSPVASALSVSLASVSHGHSVTLRGAVTAPMPLGSVRIYVIRPGTTKPVVLADRSLVSGAWSMPIRPTVHGTYKFTARYMGYGPWGPVTSASARLRVK